MSRVPGSMLGAQHVRRSTLPARPSLATRPRGRGCWGVQVPAGLFDALAALHARYHGASGLPAAIPRVTADWWQALCREWVDPRLRE